MYQTAKCLSKQGIQKSYVPEFLIYSALKCTCGFYRYERVYTYKREENYATALKNCYLFIKKC